MIVRNGVRPNKVTTLFFHAATICMVVFLIFLATSFIAPERLIEPWSGVGAASFAGFLGCCVVYTIGNAIDRWRAKRKGPPHG